MHPTTWEINVNRLMLYYYFEFFKQLIDLRRTHFELDIGSNNHEFYLFDSPNQKGFKIGLLREIADSVKDKSIGFIENLRKYQVDVIEYYRINKNYRILNDYSNENLIYQNSYGLDGIIILTQ